MAYQSEIEKLESRFREKPEQWFAALADAYRKAGDLEMALDVLNAWIGKRPNYSSGHIVLGRCLLDRGQDADAADAFENVLKLDMENVIALKSLSEIAERRADIDGAKQWLRRLLDVDPMNEEARAALDGLGGDDEVRMPEREQPAPPDVEEPDDAELVVEQLPSLEFEDREPAMEGLEPTALELERASESPDAPSGFEPTAPKTSGPPSVGVPKDVVRELAGLGIESMEPAIEDLAVGADEPPVIEPVVPEGPDDAVDAPEEPEAEPLFEAAELVVSDDDVADVQPIEGISFEEGAMKAPIEERTDEDVALEPLEPEPIELAAPAPAEADIAPIDGLTIDDVPPSDVETTAEQIPEVEFVQPPVPEPPPEPAADVGAETAATEAAEEPEELPLILPEEVSAELDEPAIREPEPVVTETMAELYASQGLYAEARDIYRELLDHDPHDNRLRERLERLDEEAAGRPSSDEGVRRQRYAAAATGGVSVGSMLKELLGGPVAEPDSAGRPAPSATPVSQDDAVSPTPDATSGNDDREFSFDEFFGMPKSGTDERRGSDGEDEPEDGFRDWLKGLRK